jgi:hypothetical protein
MRQSLKGVQVSPLPSIQFFRFRKKVIDLINSIAFFWKSEKLIAGSGEN